MTKICPWSPSCLILISISLHPPSSLATIAYTSKYYCVPPETTQLRTKKSSFTHTLVSYPLLYIFAHALSPAIICYTPRNNPAANEEVFFHKDGLKFFRTGDLGRMVEGKFLKITGRIKEQYKLENGKYVVPAPLEGNSSQPNQIAQLNLPVKSPS